MARASRQEWAKRVARWQRSGLTAKAFAAQAGLSAQSLSFWKWKLSREGRERSLPTFVELSAPALSSSSMLEVVVHADVTVRVPVGFDEETLTRVLRVARSAS
jgi:transposase